MLYCILSLEKSITLFEKAGFLDSLMNLNFVLKANDLGLIHLRDAS